MCIYNFARYNHTFPQRGCVTPTMLVTPTMYTSSHCSTSLLMLVFSYVFILANLVDVKWYFVVVFICSSLISNEAEGLLTHLLAIEFLLCEIACSDYLSFFFSIGLSFFFLSICTCSLNILHISSLWVR